MTEQSDNSHPPGNGKTGRSGMRNMPVSQQDRFAHADTSCDDFLDGKVRVFQPQNGYRAGIDAVLLAATASVSDGTGARILDAGAGAGTVGLCVAARHERAQLTLVECQPALAALARKNIALNGWHNRMSVIEGDLTGPAAPLVARGLQLETYDQVLANPPFHISQHGTSAPDPSKAQAHTMGADELNLWARFLAAASRPGGSVTIIHRPDHLPQLLSVLERRFGALRLKPVHSHRGKPAHRIIVRGIKASRAPLSILPALVMHDDEGAFTPAANAILRHGEPLQMG